MSVVGVLPMAGKGSRLGLPFPKPLAPVFVGDTIVPLYDFAHRRLLHVADEVCAVLAPEHDSCLDGLPFHSHHKSDRGETSTSVALAGRRHPGALLAVTFPDTVWDPEDGFRTALDALTDDVDGVLLTFMGKGTVLDQVVTDADGLVLGVYPKHPRRGYVEGWGSFIARADAVADWTDEVPIGTNLARLRLRRVLLDGEYHDLGTPEHYRRFIAK